MENVSLAVAFGAGLLTFLSPCVLPLVPVYLANLSGVQVFDPGTNAKRASVFMHSLSFVAGFSVVFVLFGAGAGLLGFVISQNLPLVRKIAGSLLVLFGVFMLAAMKVSWLNYEKRLSSTGRGTGHVRSVLTGSVFAVAWTPCVGPVLGGILAFAMSSETAFQGALMLSVYSLGLGLPFLAAGAFFGAVSPLLRKVRRFAPVLQVSSAILLIVVGILVIGDKLTWLQRFAI